MFKCFDRFVTKLEGWFVWVASIITLANILYVSLAAISRFFFNHPLPGHIDISQLVIGVTVFLGLAWVQRLGGHARVDVIYTRFHGWPKRIADSLILIMALFLFGTIAVYGLQYALFMREVGDTTATIGLVTWPFKLTIFLGSLLLCLRLGQQIFSNLAPATASHGELKARPDPAPEG